MLVVGLSYDNLNLLSLTFFSLVLSAVEFGVGLVIMLIQHLLTRAINLDVGGNSAFKFTRGSARLPLVNRLV